jgi:6-phosphogluconolactonase
VYQTGAKRSKSTFLFYRILPVLLKDFYIHAMKYIVSLFLLMGSLDCLAQKNYFMIVGTYTSGSSQGLYVFQFNSSNADIKLVDSAKTSNPSYLTVSPNEKYVYAVNEDADSTGNGGRVSSFSFNNVTGALALMNQQPSKGNHPCYITVDKSGRWVLVGNYSSGTVSVLPVLKAGSLDTAVTTIRHSGKSVNADRQNSSHVHATVLSPDNQFLFVPDLGIDKVMIYHFNTHNGKLNPAAPSFIATNPGTGPRHFIFHPYKKYAYLIEELAGNIVAFSYKTVAGHLVPIQNISTLPQGYTAAAGSADIHISPDGNFLYASNRGESNTIAIFAINQKNGFLTLLGHQSALGLTPRNFNFDPSGNFLLVANQNSNEIVIFKRDLNTGLLTDTGKRIRLSKPVCIKWIEARF